ncbi:hypothetical protein WH87_02140 [Devosia epidermidihirudinis]|uniref:Uncharacterized protein n=1 Tax=Devosia epidermidihirudinis TaxID=1293439 RepID=A0A0F5QJ36_9HYPH|nr:hypothetical protein [Devosia epidermidihirudinis]KKC40975.1 hypothetical protein WH87_02140 [Devosia epidermidihirudinis]
MATSTISQTSASVFVAKGQDVLGLLFAMAMPLAAFSFINWIVEVDGMLPLFFSPFGLPGWIGAALYLGTLPLLGASWHLVHREGVAGSSASWWVAALAIGFVGFPFVVTPLDSFALSAFAVALSLIGFAAALRAASVSPLAGWVMAPALLWMGFSALVGLAFTAAWAPPFALTNTQNSL